MILHFLTNKIGVIATVSHLGRRQKFKELESTLQVQVLCKYLILSS